MFDFIASFIIALYCGVFYVLLKEYSDRKR